MGYLIVLIVVLAALFLLDLRAGRIEKEKRRARDRAYFQSDDFRERWL